jgi:quinol monooxygenase YgiN
MIIEYIRYAIDAEQATTFERAYAAASAALDASSHCRAYDLAHCVDDPTQYVLRIEWDTAEGHLQGFRRSPEFTAFFTAVRPFVSEIAEMRHYTLTNVQRRKDDSQVEAAHG